MRGMAQMKGVCQLVVGGKGISSRQLHLSPNATFLPYYNASNIFYKLAAVAATGVMRPEVGYLSPKYFRSTEKCVLFWNIRVCFL